MIKLSCVEGLLPQGDGSTMSPAQWTYTGHRKSVLAVGFCETARLAVSCDSAVHLWDPYVGRVVAVSDSARCPPVNTLRPLPSPSHQVYQHLCTCQYSNKKLIRFILVLNSTQEKDVRKSLKMCIKL